MAGLEAKEGDARRSLDRDAAHLAGRAVQPRRHVDREHRAAAPGEGVDPLDDRPRLAVDVAREACAEEGVDHAIRAAERDVRRSADRPLEARSGDRGVAAERLAPAEETKLDGKAASREEPRRDETVAAVVTGTADDDDQPPRAREPRSLVRDGEPRALHQRDAGRSGRDGRPVGLAHLGRRQQFGVLQRVQHAGLGWRRAAPAASGESALSIATNSAISRSC